MTIISTTIFCTRIIILENKRLDGKANEDGFYASEPDEMEKFERCISKNDASVKN